ncbi:hypothetical protein DFH08DRAFT_722830 [Mycena albidolilacea]|uniref:Transposase n=1 Tax=Mycena albidolilacea TaxID=1033008 RepID=A0AAD7E8B7_9AGAR|nr:hypothetical protein DFH08DRAFT_722830 [Mycena albidolilacea]
MLHGLNRLIGLILAPLLVSEDHIFDLHKHLNDPVQPLLALADTFTNNESLRPAVGGAQCTREWLWSIPRRDCKWCFRHVSTFIEELEDLARCLKIPKIFRTRNRYTFERVEALCLLIAWFQLAGDQCELSMKYNRSQTAISEVVNKLVEFLDDRWAHLLEFDHNGLLMTQRLQLYADAIHMKGSLLRLIWGFIDCTIRCMCRPSWWQQQVYNGHKKVHALKFQAIRLPDGLIGHLFGPIEG